VNDAELARLVRRMRGLALLIRALTVFGYIGFGFFLGMLFFAWKFGKFS
jgi:hypothetical protein